MFNDEKLLLIVYVNLNIVYLRGNYLYLHQTKWKFSYMDNKFLKIHFKKICCIMQGGGRVGLQLFIWKKIQ